MRGSMTIHRRVFRGEGRPVIRQFWILLSHIFVRERTHTDHGFLPLDSQDEFFLFNFHGQIFAFQVTRNFDCDVDVANCLGPFIGQSSLLFYFFCMSCCFFGGGWFWEFNVSLITL